MKKILFIVLGLMHSLFGNYTIVFVHIGNQIPTYVNTSIKQARLFNKDARIILLGSEEGLQSFDDIKHSDNIELCAYESLKLSSIHLKFIKDCKEKHLFWRYTSERFLYLWDLINAYNLENIFHLENDNMLYANLDELIPIFKKTLPGNRGYF